MFELKGRVALVTGAGRGIGIGIAAALAQQGALVAVNDLREDRAQRSVDAINAQGGTAIGAAFDVTDYDAVAAGVEAITTDLGPVDIVVNNAGIPPGGIPTKPFALSDRTDWHRFVDVNLFGVLNTVLYFPSGAVYPQQGFPGWMQVIAVADPFTYAVHAFKGLLLKNTGFDAIAFDLGFLVIFSIIMMTAATLLFRRTL